MPKHNQQGYAVVDCTYTMIYTKNSEERYTLSHQAYQKPVHETKETRQSEIIRYTWYAKCKKNQTNDVFLSQWYSEVVIPDSELVIRGAIEKSKEDNAERVKRWEEHLTKGWIKQNAPPPPRLEYDDFDAKMLELKRIFGAEDEPPKDQGKKVRWTE